MKPVTGFSVLIAAAFSLAAFPTTAMRQQTEAVVIATGLQGERDEKEGDHVTSVMTHDLFLA